MTHARPHTSRLVRQCIVTGLAMLTVAWTKPQLPRPTTTALPSGALHGQLLSFPLDGHTGYIVLPATATRATGSPWIWIVPTNFFTGAQIAAGSDSELYANAWLDAGYPLAGMDLGLTCGSPASMRIFEDFYATVVKTYDLNAKVRFFAGSRGGLEAYGFATRHPDLVDRIGGIYPVVDWRSWPGIDKLPLFPDSDVGFTPADLTHLDSLNPVNNLDRLAQHGVKLFHIHGDRDETVNINVNSRAVIDKYRAMGGQAELLVINLWGHEGTGTFQPEMVRFLKGLPPHS